MANQIGKNQYGIYDLDKIKQALGEKEWEAVLRPFQYVRMATAAQLEEATGLSRQVVARTLKALLAVEDVAQDPAGAPPPGGEPERVEPEGAPEARVRRVLTTAPHRLAYRAYHTKPATVYLLGQVGAALLRELGLVKDLRACEESRPLALAHSLCILDVILLGQAQGQTALRAEKELAAERVIDALEQRIPWIRNKVEVRDVATPVTWERYTGNWRGSYEGWLPSGQSLGKQMPKTLPGLADFYMVGQWVSPGGGLPPAVSTGRHVVEILCKKDGKRFVATEA